MKALLVLAVLSAATPPAHPQQPTVRVAPANPQGPRPLAAPTRAAAVHDYLEAWQAMRSALDQNRAELLDTDFVGLAREKLGETIAEQATLGLRTRYQDRAHNLEFVFYSPEGLSIELVDTVDYDVELLDHDKLQTTQHVHARYAVVLTPAEVRWRVRVLQGDPE